MGWTPATKKSAFQPNICLDLRIPDQSGNTDHIDETGRSQKKSPDNVTNAKKVGPD